MIIVNATDESTSIIIYFAVWIKSGGFFSCFQCWKLKVEPRTLYSSVYKPVHFEIEIGSIRYIDETDHLPQLVIFQGMWGSETQWCFGCADSTFCSLLSGINMIWADIVFFRIIITWILLFQIGGFREHGYQFDWKRHIW